MGDLSDRYPPVSAATSGKLRLVGLLVEGGADVSGSDLRGDTALVAACKSLRRGDDVDDTANKVLKVINCLSQNNVVSEACRAVSRDVIIISTDTVTNGTNLSEEMTEDFLNYPLSPDPSDIVLKTRAPKSTGGAAGGRRAHIPRQRGLSEPWLAIPDLTRLLQTQKRDITQRDDYPSTEEHDPGFSQSRLTPPRPMLHPSSSKGSVGPY